MNPTPLMQMPSERRLVCRNLEDTLKALPPDEQLRVTHAAAKLWQTVEVLLAEKDVRNTAWHAEQMEHRLRELVRTAPAILAMLLASGASHVVTIYAAIQRERERIEARLKQRGGK